MAGLQLSTTTQSVGGGGRTTEFAALHTLCVITCASLNPLKYSGELLRVCMHRRCHHQDLQAGVALPLPRGEEVLVRCLRKWESWRGGGGSAFAGRICYSLFPCFAVRL